MDVTNLEDLLPNSTAPTREMYTVGVMINFTVDRTVLPSTMQREPSLFLYGRFHGDKFATQIKGSYIVHVSEFRSS